MKQEIERLIALQKIEIERADIRAFLDSVDERLKSLDEKLSASEQAMTDHSAFLNDMKKKYRSYEMDIQNNTSIIKKNQEKLLSIKSNKEYQALLKGIDELKEKSSQTEDIMLEYLEQIDAAEKNISEKKKEYERLKKEISAEKEMVRLDSEKKQKRIADFEKQLLSLSGMLDHNLLDRYNMIKKKTGSTAIVSVKDSVCMGCNLNIPPQMYNELQRGDSLKICPHCQRIIYWEKPLVTKS